MSTEPQGNVDSNREILMPDTVVHHADSFDVAIHDNGDVVGGVPTRSQEDEAYDHHNHHGGFEDEMDSYGHEDNHYQGHHTSAKQEPQDEQYLAEDANGDPKANYYRAHLSNGKDSGIKNEPPAAQEWTSMEDMDALHRKRDQSQLQSQLDGVKNVDSNPVKPEVRAQGSRSTTPIPPNMGGGNPRGNGNMNINRLLPDHGTAFVPGAGPEELAPKSLDHFKRGYEERAAQRDKEYYTQKARQQARREQRASKTTTSTTSGGNGNGGGNGGGGNGGGGGGNGNGSGNNGPSSHHQQQPSNAFTATNTAAVSGGRDPDRMRYSPQGGRGGAAGDVQFQGGHHPRHGPSTAAKSPGNVGGAGSIRYQDDPWNFRERPTIINGLDILALIDRLTAKIQNPVLVEDELQDVRMKHRDIFDNGKALTAVISAAARRRNIDLAHIVWDWMDRVNIRKNTFHYNSMISVTEKARNYRLALDLLREMSQRKIPKNEVTFSSAISACEKCGQWKTAIDLLDQMDEEGVPRTAIAFNATISACEKGMVPQKACEVFQLMKREGVEPTVVSYSALISAAEKGGQWKLALEILQEMNDVGFKGNVVGYSAAISALAKGQQWEKALQLFREIQSCGGQPSIVTYNATMTALEKGMQWERALAMFEEMKMRNLPITVVSYGSAISACDKGLQYRQCLEYLDEMTEMGIAKNVIIFGAAMSCMEKCCRADICFQLMERMKMEGISPNVHIYNSAISACARSNFWEKGYELFKEMDIENVKRDVVTYNAVLDAVASQIALGRRLFEEGVQKGFYARVSRLGEHWFELDLHFLSLGGGEIALGWWFEECLVPYLVNTEKLKNIKSISIVTGYGKTRTRGRRQGDDGMRKRCRAMLRFMNIKELDQPNAGRIHVDKDALIEEVERTGGKVIFDLDAYTRWKETETTANVVPDVPQKIRARFKPETPGSGRPPFIRVETENTTLEYRLENQGRSQDDYGDYDAAGNYGVGGGAYGDHRDRPSAATAAPMDRNNSRDGGGGVGFGRRSSYDRPGGGRDDRFGGGSGGGGGSYYGNGRNLEQAEHRRSSFDDTRRGPGRPYENSNKRDADSSMDLRGPPARLKSEENYYGGGGPPRRDIDMKRDALDPYRGDGDYGGGRHIEQQEDHRGHYHHQHQREGRYHNQEVDGGGGGGGHHGNNDLQGRDGDRDPHQHHSSSHQHHHHHSHSSDRSYLSGGRSNSRSRGASEHYGPRGGGGTSDYHRHGHDGDYGEGRYGGGAARSSSYGDNDRYDRESAGSGGRRIPEGVPPGLAGRFEPAVKAPPVQVAGDGRRSGGNDPYYGHSTDASGAITHAAGSKNYDTYGQYGPSAGAVGTAYPNAATHAYARDEGYGNGPGIDGGGHADPTSRQGEDGSHGLDRKRSAEAAVERRDTSRGYRLEPQPQRRRLS